MSQRIISTAVADVELLDSLSRMNIESAEAPEQHLNSPSETMPCQDGEHLLGGPSVLLIVSHSGTPFDYAHQCSAAKGIVSADRIRQLTEETESENRPYAIEFPARALATASKTFRNVYEANPEISQLPLDMGNILPGYVMCVFDWLVQDLRRKIPIPFVPDIPVIDGEDKWYWLYCYATMRCLGMEQAEELQHFVVLMIDHDSLVAESESYIHLLRVLQPSDPVVAYLAERTAQQMAATTLGLSSAQCQDIGAQYPHFATLVKEALLKI
jgi:hypothetical protein